MARHGFPEWDNTSGLPTGIDLNNIKSTGIFDVIGAKNGPAGVSSMYVQIMSTSQATPYYQNVIQRAYPHDGSSGFVRYFNGTSWSSWVADSPTAATGSLTATGHYYVDGTNGNDNNDGRSTDKAWRTLTRAGLVLSGVEANGNGQVILNILPGTYTEALTIIQKTANSYKFGSGHLQIQSAFPSNLTSAATTILNGQITLRGGSDEFSVTLLGIKYAGLSITKADGVTISNCIAGASTSGFGQFTGCKSVIIGSCTFDAASAAYLVNAIGAPDSLMFLSVSSIVFSQVTNFTDAVIKMSNWVFYSPASNHTGAVTGKQYSREWSSNVPRPVYYAALTTLTGSNVFTNYLGNLPPTVNVGNRKVSGFIKGFATNDTVRVVIPQGHTARLLKAKLYLSGAATATAQWRRGGSAIGTNAALTQGGVDTQTFDIILRNGTDPIELAITAQTTGAQGVLHYELLFEDLAPDYIAYA